MRVTPVEWKERSTGIRTSYLFAVVDLACVVNFPDWRHGLVRLGLLEAWSWVLAPIGLILVIAASIASWLASYGENDNHPRWVWVVALVVYLAAAFGYVTVAFGLSAWIKS